MGIGMEAFAGIALTAMLVAGISAGTRILAVAWRTRRDPELWIGLAVLMSSIGGACETVSLKLAVAGHLEAAANLQATAWFVYLIGISAHAVGMWRIFRPDRLWAPVLAFTLSMAFAAVWGASLIVGEHTHVTGFTFVMLMVQLLRLAGFSWGGIESLLYCRRLRRQARLGLSDTVMANQFLLWAIASFAMVGLLLVVIGSFVLMGVSPLKSNAGMLALSACGAVGASTIYTAFFPPAFYRRWVTADATP